MKKFTLLITLIAFFAVNTFAQSVTTIPALDVSTTTPSIHFSNNGDVTITVNNPKPNVQYTLLKPGAPPTIIEQLTANASGDKLSFKKLQFSLPGTYNYNVLSKDYGVAESFNVVVGPIKKKTAAN